MSGVNRKERKEQEGLLRSQLLAVEGVNRSK